MRIIPTQIDSVKKQIDKWETGAIVVRSKGEYARPLVIVNKNNGEMRLRVDYKRLNL